MRGSPATQARPGAARALAVTAMRLRRLQSPRRSGTDRTPVPRNLRPTGRSSSYCSRRELARRGQNAHLVRFDYRLPHRRERPGGKGDYCDNAAA